ncbi:MAG: hypothetical protein AAF702_11935 [Chloroflexota bacterium]
MISKETVELTNELSVLRSMAGELEDYIIEGEVYRTVLVPQGGGNSSSQMSGGDLLARLAELQEASPTMSATEQAQVAETAEQIQATIRSLRTRFHGILERELKARRDISKWDDEERINQDKDKNYIAPAEMDNRKRIDIIRKTLAS